MATDLASELQRAHDMIDGLSPEKLLAITRLLEVMVEPLSANLGRAPVDDEELSPAMVNRIQQAEASLGRGVHVEHAEILRDLGHTS